MKNYFVLEKGTDKVLGFNLTREESDKLFYHIDKGDGHKSSDGRSYGALDFKAKNKEELQNVLSLRNHFKNCNQYSYVILTDDNEWVATGHDETEKEVLNSIEFAKKYFTDAEDFLIFEITGTGMSV